VFATAGETIAKREIQRQTAQKGRKGRISLDRASTRLENCIYAMVIFRVYLTHCDLDAVKTDSEAVAEYERLEAKAEQLDRLYYQ
jgi:hypothetical protein